MTLTLGFSPCPNDTFIFDALVNRKIDTAGFDFKVVLDDVQTLNAWAIEGKLDITKLSYGVLPLVMDRYVVLNSGSALGQGVGPLLISNTELKNNSVEDQLIAIPGKDTTAHLLFSLAYPGAQNKVFIRYDEIEQFVIENKGLGVIIHENRFTYESKGLKKVVDLGAYWEQQTQLPIPLGGIVMRRTIADAVQKKIDALIKKSIEYGFANYPVLSDYIREHAQEMSEDVMRSHIDLYVNDYSIELGATGKNAVERLVAIYNSSITADKNPAKQIFLD